MFPGEAHGQGQFYGDHFPNPQLPHTHLPQMGSLSLFEGQLCLSNKDNSNPVGFWGGS